MGTPISALLAGLRKVTENSGNVREGTPLSENVSSSAISRVDFEPLGGATKSFIRGDFLSALTEGTLTITFQARGTYEYYNVPATTWIALKSAGSKGGYFNANIREAGYSYARVG